MTHSYLFTCHLTDGTTIQQTQEDISKEDSTRSAFYDVMQRLDDIETFTLTKQDARQHTYMVDLRDGHFEIDATPFQVSSEDLPGEAKFRLIYFHRHQHKVIQGQIMENGVLISYHIGWQTNSLDGRNVQQIIFVK